MKVTSPGFNPAAPCAGAITLTVVVGIAYFVAAQLSLEILAEPDGVALFWPAAGVSAGVLIALGRAARVPVVCGVAVATVIANLIADRSVWNAGASALWDTGEAVLAAWLVERCFGANFSLDRLRNVLGLVAVAVVATAASGIGGMTSFKLFDSPTAPMWTTWLHWLASDSVGMITVAPLTIGIVRAVRAPPPPKEILEGIAALAAVSAAIAVAMLMPPDWQQTVRPGALLLPILLWLTARCQPVFTAAAAFLVSLAVVWAMALGTGRLGATGLPIFDRVLEAQSTIIVFTLYAHVLAALFAERRRQAARLQEALTVGGVIAFRYNAATDLAHTSDNVATILGLGPPSTFPLTKLRPHIHPDDLAHVVAHYRSACAHTPTTFTFRFNRPDGREVWLEETSQVEFDTAGRITRVQGLTRDITTRKQAELHQDLLLAELDHRVKNLLARVAAIVRQAHHPCESVDEFINALHGRIQSMAAAHALLSQTRWSDVRLSDLIRHQLAPYTTDANTTITGPEIMLTSAQTQAVAMVVHELVTNAAKHGALSRPDGRVKVDWSHAGADAAVLTLVWQERDGPPTKPAKRSGYGSTLIRGLIPHELGGAVDLTFPPDGACCTIKIPLQRSAGAGRDGGLMGTTTDFDGYRVGIRKFFSGVSAAAQREMERAIENAQRMQKLTGGTLPARAVVTVSGIDFEFEIDGHIEVE